MKIVITDGYTLNPGDLSWEEFGQFGDVIYYDRTEPAQVTERCREATVIITNKTPIQAETISRAVHLKIIAVSATGYNIVDIEAAKKRNILVCNVPVYGTDSVAQHAFALLLELSNQTGKHIQSVKNGDWFRSADWSYSLAPIIELRNKTLGLVGFGKIGQQVARIGQAFGMKIIYHNRSGQTNQPGYLSLEALFAQSDFISLHCPLSADNYAFINWKLFSLMKPTAFLINTARGQLINEADLADALEKGKLSGAALDVLAVEPPAEGHPLIGLPNCIITPHNAWVSFEARQRLMQTTFDNIAHALGGSAQNVVNR